MRSPDPKRRCSRALILALLLLGAQTLAAAHEHVDNVPDTSCAVCTLAQAQTGACDSQGPALPPKPSPDAPETLGVPPAASGVGIPYRSRGPPAG